MASATKRIPTGVPGLDRLISGGVPEGSIVLVTGAPGTGKTIFCAQFCAANKKEDASFVCIEEETADVLIQAEQFGIGLNGVSIISARELRFGTKQKPNDLEERINLLLEKLKETGAKALAIDSVSSLEIVDSDKTRTIIERLIEGLKELGATVILTGEAINGDYPDMFTPFLSDGIIKLYLEEGEGKRKLTIPKMRLTEQGDNTYLIRIDKGGLRVL